MSPDTRAKMVKAAHQYAEGARVAVRGVRKKAFADIKKAGPASEDERKRLEKQVDEFTKSHVEMVDAALARKEKDLAA